jgi:basic membrane lipoprotein Med (substrate-binding protein (PBP1-ABC) superfamily)/DNA-binding SARP family transcriptional activator
MEFRVLGALEAGSGGTAVDLGPPKQRALLAILLLHVGEIVPVDRLIDLLWGDEAPRTAGHSIQIYISELRKALEAPAGPRLIVRRHPGYQLDVPAERIDAHRFEALVRRGSALLAAGEREEGIKTLRSSLDLWRGPALSDFTYEEFAQPYVRRFHDLHLDAIETLAAAELEAGQAASVVGLLEAAIREDPLRERSRELLMLALYRAGRHAEALRSFEKLRELLVEELGLEPSPPLQQLRDRVLLHGPSLLPVATREPARGTARNPYKGLQPFAEGDADDFFGREALIERLLGNLASGGRLLALVGPSGSGKSSIVAAGLIPRLHRGAVPGSDRWMVVSLTVGPDPQADLAALVARARGGDSAGGGSSGRHLTSEEGTRLVIVIDHFEQLFTVPEESRRNHFLDDLAMAIDDESGPIVVLGLRADFYDRPLQHSRFSEAFVPGVVHVLPMTARELEAAVVEPAERVGVTIESKLLAELIAESVARPGSLPLLQYALTELFEQRTGPVLTLAGYTAVGGLRGVLSRRAEGTFLGLGPEEQRIATQVFLRLVRLGRGTADSRRRLVVAELADMDVDAVALSAVLSAFARHRLLTFDRDELTGQATVELAHEALLTEWDRLAGWIDRHRAALRRRDALLAAVDEWELSDRNPDYLLAGSRLGEFAAWSQEGSLQLTARERAYLEAGLDREQAAVQAETARTAAHRRLQRSARLRLVGLAGMVLAVAGAGVFWVLAAPPPPPRPVALMFTDEGLVNTQIQAGFDRAVTDFGLQGQKFTWDGLWDRLIAKHGDEFWQNRSDDEVSALHSAEQQAQIREVANDAGLIVTFGVFHEDVEVVAADFPRTWFFSDQLSTLDNVVAAKFVDSQPSYLAGAAAALTTKTGVIGYIGGVDWEGIWGFQAGYEAGARAIDPNIRILVEYISRPEEGFFGFDDADAARALAMTMYGEGADVVMHAAGDSGLGLFEAATEFSRAEARHVWAIGVDTDQYETVLRLPGASDAELWRKHILTSVRKGLDALTYAALDEYAAGRFGRDGWTWGLDAGASGLSYSGGYLDAHRDQLEALEADILAKRIVVPCIPDDHVDEARALGIGSTYCYD